MILEIYVAFFVLTVLFLALGVKTSSASIIYLSMGMLLFSSLVMASSGIDVVTGTSISEVGDATVVSNVYTTYTLDNNFFVMTYVYIFLILPIIGILSSIYYAQRDVNRR